MKWWQEFMSENNFFSWLRIFVIISELKTLEGWLLKIYQAVQKCLQKKDSSGLIGKKIKTQNWLRGFFLWYSCQYKI